MKDYLSNVSLIDLVSEKQQELRVKIVNIGEERWGESVTQSESNMLAVIEKENMTIAEAARKINVSRQAAHKCVQGLITRGYINTTSIEGNQRNKLIVLTDKGKKYCNEMIVIKREVEEEIEESIGKANIELLRQCLNSKWF
ncbi:MULTISPECIES: MarR family transcriptional regulator [Clostridium]|uniref:Winged helix DNA-binding protein n=1 Tax=Clostridium cibarium TaxID=2762247 RepID=A0ABR8PRI8_9CLOT|nr:MULTISPECIES: MarR family transcriptional regulator [Clostridium]MBD7910790.1 winged helix DNA-binding protein [Clostridium cibarium]